MPRWLGWAATAVGIPLGLFFFQHWWSRRPQGERQAPMPMDNPPSGPLVYPEPQPIDAEQLFTLLAEVGDLARWQAAPLVGEAVLANPGGTVIGNNPARLRAGSTWPGAWTSIRTAALISGQPRHQWTPIRSYPSMRMGVTDWLNAIPSRAYAALLEGDAHEFARVLVDAGQIQSDPAVYAAYLAEATAPWLDPA